MVMSTLLDGSKSMSDKPKKKHWIKAAVEHKGALHRNLGVPDGEKIPAEKMAEAKKSKNPKIRKEAALAETLKGMKHKKPHELMKSLYGHKKKHEKKD